MLSKNHDTEETDASTTLERDNSSHHVFDNKDTQTEIVMAIIKDTSLNTSGQQWYMTGMNKSIIKPQKVAPIDLETPEDQL